MPARPSRKGRATPAATSSPSTTEGIAQLFQTWARQVPPSIPATEADAKAAAAMWRQIADAMRMRAQLDQEQNNLPEDCVAPMVEAARRASAIGDAHMEQHRLIVRRYAEVANTLADPRSPNAEYLGQGA